jgi:recombination protein U
LKETYLLPAIHLIHYYHSDQGTKSMPLTYIREFGYVVDELISISSYLSVIEKTIRW